MGAVRQRVMQGVLIDPDVVAYAARVTVWGRWFIWAFSIYLMAYRPGFWFPQDAEYLVVHGSLGLHNGLVHYRLLTHRPVTWRWMLVLCAMDVALITASIVIFGGFGSFNLPVLLSGHGHICRGLLILLAQLRLGDDRGPSRTPPSVWLPAPVSTSTRGTTEG